MPGRCLLGGSAYIPIVDQRLRIFLGSASESLHVAEAFQAVLPNNLEVTVWPDVFNVGEYALDDLREASRQHDFAVFVFSPDDEVRSRDQLSLAPRDNVVFELGLFSATLGPRRTFVLKAAGPSVKVPSDLAGVGYATYEPPQADQQDARWESAVRTGARKIRRAIDRALAPAPQDSTRAAAGDRADPTSESALDLLAADLISQARGGRLAPIGDVQQGALVVHPLHGVGQIIGFDPPGATNRSVRVRFDTGVGAIPPDELFGPPD